MLITKWLLGACAAFCASMAIAETDHVLLTSKSGELTIQGPVLDFDGRHISVSSEYGPVVLDMGNFSCVGAACPDAEIKTETLILTAPQSVLDVLMPALIENFALRRARQIDRAQQDDDTVFILAPLSDPNRTLSIDLRPMDPDFAIEALIAHETDAAVSFRPLTPDETATMLARHPASLGSPSSLVLAYDAIAPVIAPPSATQSVNITDLVTAIASDDSIFDVTNQVAMYFANHGTTTKPPIAHADLVQSLYADPARSGVVPFSNLGGLQVLDILTPCGAFPLINKRTVKSGDYPFNAPIFIHTSPYRLGTQAQEFLDYVTSPAAQMVIQRAGFVDQMMEEIPITAQGKRLAIAIAQADATTLPQLQSLLKTLDQGNRLTITFRPPDATGSLDPVSMSHIKMLAHAIKTDRFKGRAMYFVGFNFDAPDQTRNIERSQQQAADVLQALLTKIKTSDGKLNSMVSMGFGSILPNTCDGSAIGNRVNNRVEVWVK